MARPYMYDATHQNISTIPLNPAIVAGYGTGTSTVRWTALDWVRFNTAIRVVIDQSGGLASLGGPLESANVMDVEPFCYTVDEVPGWTSNCTAPRPTVYCDRNDRPAVQEIWNGDVWLAAPGISDTEALAIMTADPRIVAVQNLNAGTYDRSIIGDKYWPALPPVPPQPPVKENEMFNGMLPVGKQTDVPFPVNTFDAICFYCNHAGGGSVQMTIVLNAGGGQSVSTQTINGPVTIPFPHPTAVGVSLVNLGTTDVGWTLINQ